MRGAEEATKREEDACDGVDGGDAVVEGGDAYVEGSAKNRE